MMTSLERGALSFHPSMRHTGIPPPSTPPPHSHSISPASLGYPHHLQQHQQQSQHGELSHQQLKMEKSVYGGGSGSGGCASPPPVSSNPENNACKLIEYRGAKVAAFNVDGRELICLPQAFELFLKHLVGGLHTVYTKLKRLDVVPVVCNVEQVRVLRGLGAIQPGVNRCKLISPKEFDILYEDCTNSSARPGRPPKRSALASTPDVLKKRSLHGLGNEYYSPTAGLLDPKKSLAFGNSYMSFSDLQKAPLLTGGFHYPPHLPHLAFMPIGHPGMMNLAMATHLSMRADQLAANAHDRAVHGPDVTSTRGRDDRGERGDRMERSGTPDEPRSEHNNNNNSAKMMLSPDLDRPLNLEIHKRSSEVRPSSSTDQDSVASSGCSTSDRLVSEHHHPHHHQLDLSKKSTPVNNYELDDERHYGNDDIDAADESAEDELSDDEDGQDCSASEIQMRDCNGIPNGDLPDKIANQNAPAHFLPNSSDMSSVEMLLINIQGLIKMAVDKVHQREQQTSFEKAELKMKAIKEREIRESIEKQLIDEQRNKVQLQKRLKKEKKVRKRLQDQLEASSNRNHQSRYHHSGAIHASQTLPPPPLVPEGCCIVAPAGERDDVHIIKHSPDGHRIASESKDSEATGGLTPERPAKDRPSSRSNSNIHSLVESFIASAQKNQQQQQQQSASSSSCGLIGNGFSGQPLLLKPTETP